MHRSDTDITLSSDAWSEPHLPKSHRCTREAGVANVRDPADLVEEAAPEEDMTEEQAI